MSTPDLKGKTALVTGASSGIGAAFARRLAAAGANLVIAARRKAELDALAEELRKQHGVEVEVIAIDLGTADAPGELFMKTEGAGKTIDVLVNNAGFGEHRYFVDQQWHRVAQQLQLNIVTLTELSHRFGQAMAHRGRGHILNVASIGAYTPTPTYATYSAGKAYVRDFSEAIAFELAPRGVRVCSVCPGGTETEFHKVSGQALPGWMKTFAFMSADRCAAIGLSALFGWRRNIVTGVSNKIGMWMLRFIPRRMIVWIAARSMGKPKLPAAT
ncbi:MAG TPA: SDR family oxidoreductase [Kofleriaceae bacterium]|nr:SDR family oxidoreductase [Kofleriaceae bacterium]